MSGKRPGTWIRFWQSIKWLSRSPSLSTAQSIAEPHPVASPLVIEAGDLSTEAANLADVAARAIVVSPFPPPPVLADPAFDFETVDPGLGARQALACMLRDRAPYAVPVTAEASEIPPVPVGEADPRSEVDDLAKAAVAAQDLAKLSSFAPPLPVLADPTFDFETVDPGLGARQALACMLRDRAPYAVPVTAEASVIPSVPVGETDPRSEMDDLAKAAVAAQDLAKLSSFAPPRTANADPPAEALEPVEVAGPMQSLGPKTDFMLPARLAIVAKLNVASVREPRRHPYRFSPEKAVPLASTVQPVRVRNSQRFEAMKPMTRIMIQERPALPEIIDLDAARRALQSNPIATQAA